MPFPLARAGRTGVSQTQADEGVLLHTLPSPPRHLTEPATLNQVSSLTVFSKAAPCFGCHWFSLSLPDQPEFPLFKRCSISGSTLRITDSFLEGPLQTSHCIVPWCGFATSELPHVPHKSTSGPSCTLLLLGFPRSAGSPLGCGGLEFIPTRKLSTAGWPTGNALCYASCPTGSPLVAPPSLSRLFPCSRIIKGSTVSLAWQFSGKKQSPVPKSGEEKDSSGTRNVYGHPPSKLHCPKSQPPPLSSGFFLQQCQIREKRVCCWRLLLSNRPSGSTFRRCVIQEVWRFYQAPNTIPENQQKSNEKEAASCYKCQEVNIKIN